MLCLFALVLPCTLHAEGDGPDSIELLARVDGACPEQWEPVQSGFIGGAETVADPWRGDAADREAFKSYLGAELFEEGLQPAELETMAADPMAVVSECSFQKLQFMKFMALQDSRVSAAGPFIAGVDNGSLAVPDGRSRDYAAESCDFIGAAYPGSTSGWYWIDPDGGDAANAAQQICNFGYPLIVEAESMTTKTTGEPVEGGWNIHANGYIESEIPIVGTGRYLIELVTRGSAVAGVWPEMEVRLDQVAVASQTVNWGNWASHFAHVDIAEGSHALSIAFTNDAYAPPEDRNLHVDRVVVHFGLDDGSSPGTAAMSCKQVIDSFPGLPSGLYWIDVNGGDNADAIPVYCDQHTAGGGWTLVLAQFESDQLTDWNEGAQADYDPSLASTTSFTLHSGQLPAHNETAFGKGLDPTFVDFADYVYTTADIEKTLLVGKKTGKTYHVHRSSSAGYAYGDPEGYTATSPSVLGRFTFDETGGRKRSWCYTPGYYAQARGYSMLGSRAGSSESHAWTVWVR